MIVIGPDGRVLNEAPPGLDIHRFERLLVDLRAVGDCAAACGEPARSGRRA